MDRERLLAQIVHTDWRWLTLTILLGPAGLIARARRCRYLFPPGSNPPGIVPGMMIGYMVNNVLPLRAGELVRVYVVARRWGGRFWTATATLIVERVLDSLCIVLILGALILLVPHRMPGYVEATAVVMLVIDIIGVAVLITIVVAPDRGRQLMSRLLGRWPTVAARANRIFEMFVEGLDGIRTPSHLIPLTAWTIVIWLIPALAAWTALRAVGLDLPWLAGWVILAFVGLGVSIPSAPGYVGVFHFAAVKAVEIFGVPETAGLGYALVFHASQFIPVTVLGWIYLLREQMTIGEAARVSAEQRPTSPPSP